MSSSRSSSDSSQTQTQESQDNRITGGEGSINLSTSRSSIGGSVNITSTDFGTVSKAFDFATLIAKGAADASAASGAQVTETAKSAIESVKAAYGDVGDKLDKAYENSKAGEQRVMVAAALGVIALVAIKGGK